MTKHDNGEPERERNLNANLEKLNIREVRHSVWMRTLVSLFGLACTALTYMGTRNAHWYAILSLVLLAVVFVYALFRRP